MAIELIWFGGSTGWSLVEKGDTVVYNEQNVEETWLDASSAITALNKTSYFADVSGGSFTITLPATPSQGDYVRIHDVKGLFSINNLTVNGNGKTIMGSVTPFTLNTDARTARFVYSASEDDWRVVE